MSGGDADTLDAVPVQELPQSDRVQEVIARFVALFHKDPDFYVRVPGRVNLIGEHIDYCGYGVCPMALEQDVLLAVAVENDKMLRLHNLDPNFREFECPLDNFSISIGDVSPDWHQYFLCGVKGILDVLPKDVDIKGIKVLVSGNVPQSAGLSSSSALVSAAALATAYANKLSLSKKRIADICAECERYIGTQGGGMDQAIAFLATEGCAKFIEFSPLRSTDVILPQDAVFVIAHSLAKLNKAATADFNCRVVECRLAAQIIAGKRGLQWQNIKRLGELQHALDVDLKEMISIVKETLHAKPYTREEILRELETTSPVLEEISLTPNTRHLEKFKLQQRALHVFQEAHRVETFHSVCSTQANNTLGPDEPANSLETLGRLMTESHDSLRDLYECSHPQLDKLVKLSRDLTFGARLTGAGWGGCIVALVPPKNLEKFMEMLKEKFYKNQGYTSPQEIASVLFATSPKSGASIYIKTK